MDSNHCPECGRSYGKRRRCYYCQPGRKRTRVERACEQCGAIIEVEPNQIERGEGRYCSRECKHAALRGRPRKPLDERKPYTTKAGYVMAPVPRDERIPRGVMLEHRLVMERLLGRPLASDEQVHHVNGITNDNRPENLVVLTNAEHQRLHQHPQTRPRRVQLVCERCDGGYEVKTSKAKDSRFCSNSCRLEALHEGNRKDR